MLQDDDAGPLFFSHLGPMNCVSLCGRRPENLLLGWGKTQSSHLPGTRLSPTPLGTYHVPAPRTHGHAQTSTYTTTRMHKRGTDGTPAADPRPPFPFPARPARSARSRSASGVRRPGAGRQPGAGGAHGLEPGAWPRSRRLVEFDGGGPLSGVGGPKSLG